MEILEEILERLKQINNYIANLYEGFNFSSYSRGNLEAHINNAKRQYESIKTEYVSYKPFYSRGNFLFKAIESSDKIILDMYAFLAGKYDNLKCPDCSWKGRLEGINKLYSKLKKQNVMGQEFYKKELQEIVEILEKSNISKQYKRKVKKLTKKINKKGIIKKIIKAIKRRKNGPNKSTNSRKA